MHSRTRVKQRRIYMEMWRAYYGIIILASGGAMTYFSARSGKVLFAVAIAALTLAAVGFLFMRTFRHPNRRVAKTSTASRHRTR